MKRIIAIALDVDGVLVEDDCTSAPNTLWIDKKRGQTWVENLYQMVNLARRQNVQLSIHIITAKRNFCVMMQEIFLQFRPFLQIWDKLDQCFMPYFTPKMSEANRYSLPLDINSTLYIKTFPRSSLVEHPMNNDLLYPIMLTPYRSEEFFQEAIKQKYFEGTEPFYNTRLKKYQYEYYGQRKAAKLLEISEKLGVFREQIIMVDDSDFIIEKAKAEGFRTIHATKETLPVIFDAIRSQLNEAIEQLDHKASSKAKPPTYIVPQTPLAKIAAAAVRVVNEHVTATATSRIAFFSGKSNSSQSDRADKEAVSSTLYI